MKIRAYQTTANFPALMLVATDGFVKSHSSHDDFIEAGCSYFRTIHKEGFRAVEHQLDETSLWKTDDDVTIGLISRDEAREARTVAERTKLNAALNQIFGFMASTPPGKER